jgi:hypothetical protein
MEKKKKRDLKDLQDTFERVLEERWSSKSMLQQIKHKISSSTAPSLPISYYGDECTSSLVGS